MRIGLARVPLRQSDISPGVLLLLLFQSLFIGEWRLVASLCETAPASDPDQLTSHRYYETLLDARPRLIADSTPQPPPGWLPSPWKFQGRFFNFFGDASGLLLRTRSMTICTQSDGLI
jgi:hypothetical protein